MQVNTIMSQDIVTVTPEDTVTKLRSIMRKYGYRALPVVKENKVEGIVSRGDIMRITSTKSDVEVRGVMNSNVITANQDEDIFSVARKMHKNGVRQVVIVNAENMPVGMVSSVDIMGAFVENDYEPVKKNLDDIMTSDVMYSDIDDSISGILDKMSASGFSGFPVVKKERGINKVIGFVTRGDILKRGSLRISRESGKVKDISISKIMNPLLISVNRNKNVKEVARIMMEKRIIRVPITNDRGELVGIVDSSDVIGAYLG